MSQFVSTAIVKREGKIQFRPIRRESHATATQSRKSASRYWGGNMREGEALVKVVLVTAAISRGVLVVAERPINRGRDDPWVEFETPFAQAKGHLLAAMNELGVDATAAPPILPDVLEINGAIYRREI